MLTRTYGLDVDDQESNEGISKYQTAILQAKAKELQKRIKKYLDLCGENG